ncbi:MAG: TonB-dependent receptor plug domain-containing protein [Proteobacteria bacterium]|nr:TonB-dependent receptor plug domain-containing protein [Pseudomonadota bacterium]
MSTRSKSLLRCSALLVLAGAAHPALAPAEETTAIATSALERIVVTARRIDAAQVGGSVAFIDSVQLAKHSFSDVNRVLRQVPGLNIVEEEGFGIRPSIGIRGSGTDRNTKIVVMEDAVPIAPAPYSAPAAYYFPRIPRMSAVEVSKGPAAIKYGRKPWQAPSTCSRRQSPR